jgi:hypothetical protein
MHPEISSIHWKKCNDIASHSSRSRAVQLKIKAAFRYLTKYIQIPSRDEVKIEQ